jgi:hypothetical protein
MGILYQAGQRAVIDGDDQIGSLEDRLPAQAEISRYESAFGVQTLLVHVRRAVGPQREIFNQLTPLSSPRQTMSRTWKPPSNNSAQSAWI